MKGTDDESLRAMWRGAGGSFHGPNVERGSMPEEKLLPFLRSLLSNGKLAECPRAGPVLTAAINLFREKPERSAVEIIDKLSAAGIVATDREIYNALGYLTRKGHVRRISYGRYLAPPPPAAPPKPTDAKGE